MELHIHMWIKLWFMSTFQILLNVITLSNARENLYSDWNSNLEGNFLEEILKYFGKLENFKNSGEIWIVY